MSRIPAHSSSVVTVMIAVEMLATEFEGEIADLLHRHTVGEGPDVIEGHRPPGFQGGLHAGGVGRFDAEHLGLRPPHLDVGGDPGGQTAAAHRDEHGVDGLRGLVEDLPPDGALSGDHIEVVERMNETKAVVFGPLPGQLLGVVVVLAVQHDFASERLDRLDLDLRGRQRHDHIGRDTAPGRRHRHPLGVVSSRTADDTAVEVGVVEAENLVGRPPDLEREGRLLILTFEQHLIPQPFGQQRRGGE